MRNATFSWRAVLAAGFAGATVCLGATAASAQEAPEILGLKDGTIGFVLTSTRWGIHQTPEGKEECPQGFNEGPREQFKALYPNGGTVVGTQLERESAARYPTDKEDGFVFHTVTGKTGLGLDLDGKVDADDFTSPEGLKGIDNQLYRAVGCVRMFRGQASYAHFTELWVREFKVNRIMIELSDVDSLENDDHVVVSMYRGKDKLIMDVNAQKVIPGASIRVDDRFSKRYTKRLTGKIENGVLITEPTDVSWAWSPWYSTPGYYDIKQARFQLKLDPTGQGAEGIVGGYADLDKFYQQLVRGWSTHHSSYGSMSQPSLHRALSRLADGIPDANGVNTALSSSLMVKFVQAFIEHPAPKVAAAPLAGEKTAEVTRR